MADDSVSASRVIDAPAEAIFAVLADPANHTAIDGTGWVRETTARESLTAAGQIFRMPMYHPNHPDGDYETANEVRQFEPPRVISWATGYDADDGVVRFGGWIWRYDLAPNGPASTTVALTYDWSATTAATRDLIGFPPFPPDHLANSLAHLAELLAAEPTSGR